MRSNPNPFVRPRIGRRKAVPELAAWRPAPSLRSKRHCGVVGTVSRPLGPYERKGEWAQ